MSQFAYPPYAQPVPSPNKHRRRAWLWAVLGVVVVVAVATILWVVVSTGSDGSGPGAWSSGSQVPSAEPADAAPSGDLRTRTVGDVRTQPTVIAQVDLFEGIDASSPQVSLERDTGVDGVAIAVVTEPTDDPFVASRLWLRGIDLTSGTVLWTVEEPADMVTAASTYLSSAVPNYQGRVAVMFAFDRYDQIGVMVIDVSSGQLVSSRLIDMGGTAYCDVIGYEKNVVAAACADAGGGGKFSKGLRDSNLDEEVWSLEGDMQLGLMLEVGTDLVGAPDGFVHIADGTPGGPPVDVEGYYTYSSRADALAGSLSDFSADRAEAFPVDLETGDKAWSVPCDEIGREVSIGDDGDIYVSNDDSGTLVGYRSETGEEKWSHKIDAGPGSTLVRQAGSYLYTYSYAGASEVIDPDTGESAKSFQNGGIAAGYQVLYVTDSTSTVTAYDGADSLKELWTFPLEGREYLQICGSTLVALDYTTGQMRVLG